MDALNCIVRLLASFQETLARTSLSGTLLLERPVDWRSTCFVDEVSDGNAVINAEFRKV